MGDMADLLIDQMLNLEEDDWAADEPEGLDPATPRPFDETPLADYLRSHFSEASLDHWEAMGYRSMRHRQRLEHYLTRTGTKAGRPILDGFYYALPVHLIETRAKAWKVLVLEEHFSSVPCWFPRSQCILARRKQRRVSSVPCPILYLPPWLLLRKLQDAELIYLQPFDRSSRKIRRRS